MKDEFKKAVSRDEAAAAYFQSEEFINTVRQFYTKYVLQGRRDDVIFNVKFTAKKRDQVYLDRACNILKEEFSELNHIRIVDGGLVADTKKNTVAHRTGAAFKRVFSVQA